MATLAVQHRKKVANLEGELKENADQTAAVFQEERVRSTGIEECGRDITSPTLFSVISGVGLRHIE